MIPTVSVREEGTYRRSECGKSELSVSIRPESIDHHFIIRENISDLERSKMNANSNLALTYIFHMAITASEKQDKEFHFFASLFKTRRIL